MTDLEYFVTFKLFTNEVFMKNIVLETAVAKLGGAKNLASAIGVQYKTVLEWRKAGVVSDKYIAVLAELIDLPLIEAVKLNGDQ